MNGLEKLHCSVITKDTPRAIEKDIEQYLKVLPDWRIIMKEGEQRLEKTFQLKDFDQAMDFTNKIAQIAAEEDHHPSILTEWGKVTVTWWTHRIKGLHQNDFIMAAKTDMLKGKSSRDSGERSGNVKPGEPEMHSNRSMPPGKIIPELAYDDVEAAAAWLCKAFGFVERLRIGNHRIQLVLDGESMIVIGNPARGGTSPKHHDHTIMVHVDDMDHRYKQAVLNGARIISPPAEYHFGERQFSCEDPGGHSWTFSQSVADVDPADWGGVVIEKIE